jgi:hypothetical protein
MKSFLRFTILPIIVGLFFAFISPTVANAAVDIELVENEVDNTISIIVDSNGSYVDGITLEIIHPEEVVIDEENAVKSEEFCTIGNTISKKYTSFSIECFNDLNTVMDGEILRVPFYTDSEEYYFYVDQDSVNLGYLTLGEVSDINRPDNIVFDDYEGDLDDTGVETTETESTEGIENIREFVKENILYILLGVIGILVITIIVVFISSGKEKTTSEEAPPAIE